MTTAYDPATPEGRARLRRILEGAVARGNLRAPVAPELVLEVLDLLECETPAPEAATPGREPHIAATVDAHGSLGCQCGNTPEWDGFTACDEVGRDTEPVPGWPGLYRCDRCGRVVDGETGELRWWVARAPHGTVGNANGVGGA